MADLSPVHVCSLCAVPACVASCVLNRDACMSEKSACKILNSQHRVTHPEQLCKMATAALLKLVPCVLGEQPSGRPGFMPVKTYIRKLPAELRQRAIMHANEQIKRMLVKDAPHGARYAFAVSKALGKVSVTIRKGAACSNSRFDMYAWLAGFAQRYVPDHDKVFEELHHAGRLDVDAATPRLVLDLVTVSIQQEPCWTRQRLQGQIGYLSEVHPRWRNP